MDFNKPRVAIYYHVLPSTGMRNDGCPLFINYNLRKILHGINSADEMKAKRDMSNETGNVVHLWPTKEAEKFGKFDLHVWCDYGEDALNVPLDWSPPSPSAYWCSDAHISEKSYKYRLERAKKFDFVFCAQKRCMDEFERDGIPKEKLFWLPHAAEPDVYKPYDIIEKWDWCFIGHINSEHRVNLVDRFCKEFPVGMKGYLGWRSAAQPGWNVLDDAAKKFSQSRIILNDNINEDVNMRTFEGMATKKMLLTQDIPYLSEIFKDGQHLVLYKNIDDAVEKAKYYLSNESERIRISESGYNEVLAKHTYKHRALEILKTCLNYEPAKEVVNAH